MLEQFPEIDLGLNKVGIFGKLARTDTMLRDRDRVEIYRALIADPKEARRRRAQAAKRSRK
jgi:putative ubiquitin-RnfH superfamily antitoxin RatB of RatAB toxin-antitoxin module